MKHVAPAIFSSVFLIVSHLAFAQTAANTASCDATRTQLRSAAIKTYGIDQVLPLSVKLVGIISSQDMEKIRLDLNTTGEVTNGLSYNLSAQEVFSILTAAQRKLRESEIIDNNLGRIYTLGSAISEDDHTFQVGASWPATKSTATNGDVDGVGEVVINFNPTTQAYSVELKKHDTAAGAAPSFVNTSLMDFVNKKLPSACTGVPSALSAVQFNDINDLLN